MGAKVPWLRRHEVLGENWILESFPANYRLYERIKQHAKDVGKAEDPTAVEPTNSSSRSSKHRRDTYLYGYPGGVTKRYRSPQDFHPHLVWLACTEDMDHGDCGCKFCCPWDLKDVMEEAGNDEEKAAYYREEKELDEADSHREVAIEKHLKTIREVETEGAGSHEDGHGWEPAPAATPMVHQSTGAENPPSYAIEPIVARPSSTRPSSTKSREQEMDALARPFVFRPGEVVWYKKDRHSWGLAVVLKRGTYENGRSEMRPRYLVQPLSHPYAHSTTAIVWQEARLRPWLGWSAPPLSNPKLRDIDPRFETVDWQAVIRGDYGQGDPSIDGSVLAAKSIDESYTLINPVPAREPTSTAKHGETYWSGIFLGAEKFWVGEAVRVHDGQDIVVVSHIVERSRMGIAALGEDGRATTVDVIGDLYKLANIPSTSEATRQLPIYAGISERLAREVQERNFCQARSINLPRKTYYWQLVESNVRLGLDEVDGRWYEVHIMMNPPPPAPPQPDRDDGGTNGRASEDEEDRAYRKQKLEEMLNDDGNTGKYLNNRGGQQLRPSSGVSSRGRGGLRKSRREDALGQAVPAGTIVGLGLDGPEPDNLFPDQVVDTSTVQMAKVGGSNHGSGLVREDISAREGAAMDGETGRVTEPISSGGPYLDHLHPHLRHHHHPTTLLSPFSYPSSSITTAFPFSSSGAIVDGPVNIPTTMGEMLQGERHARDDLYSSMMHPHPHPSHQPHQSHRPHHHPHHPHELPNLDDQQHVSTDMEQYMDLDVDSNPTGHDGAEDGHW